MAVNKPLMALGLMSGTSLDGVDAAIVETDGHRVTAFGPTLAWAYPDGLRARLRDQLGAQDSDPALRREMTDFHADIVNKLLEQNDLNHFDITVIGFHGHTTDHRPAEGVTVQIGDGARLAQRTGIDVVNQFRLADVAAGGEGAPLAPLYHAALVEVLAKPVAVLNLGGVANVTWIGAGGGDEILAFDTGPGNALIDDWMAAHGDQAYDAGGETAAAGTLDEARLSPILDHEYFSRKPPKSLDRNDFRESGDKLAAGCSLADGAAALTAFTVASIAAAERYFPAPPQRWLVTGGGRRNAFLMKGLAERLSAPVMAVESVGWRGDFLEAEAFAFLAVRSLKGLALSLPATTGVGVATTGGQLHRA
jgi:anhydro-N-acetylmuramic acid kinase